MDIVSYCAGGSHTCAINDLGVVKCFGNNADGQLGLGITTIAHQGDDANEMGGSLPPVLLGSELVPVEVVCGGEHTCVQFSDGKSKCFGSNESGQLVLGDVSSRGALAEEMDDALPLTKWPDTRDVRQIVVGASHTCALLANGDEYDVKCGGLGSDGQLGYGTPDNKGVGELTVDEALLAVDFGAAKYAIDIFSGPAANHNCAILNDQGLKCWGLNGNGQLGLGDTINRGSGSNQMGDFLPFINLGASRKAVQVSLGDSHTCVICDDAAALCFGNGQHGRLGRGDSISIGDSESPLPGALVPMSLGDERMATKVSAGKDFTCVVLDNNGAKCFGSFADGRLGQGHMVNIGDTPSKVGNFVPNINLGTGLPIQSIHAGSDHACVVFQEGPYVKCWGKNSYGQLGLGDASTRGDDIYNMGADLPFTYIFETAAPSQSPTEEGDTRTPSMNPTSRAPTTVSPTTANPTGPTEIPTASPSEVPSTSPSSVPSSSPTDPTEIPTTSPTGPTDIPTTNPSAAPSINPTMPPSKSPTPPTEHPSKSPTQKPTTKAPTTRSPTVSPTTRSPTTRSPTSDPTTATPTNPTQSPTTKSPTFPTESPTTRSPTTLSPTEPTPRPTTRSPTTDSPTNPTASPTTRSPTPPTESPTTRSPTTASPTEPTRSPTTRSPTTGSPTASPTDYPSPAPTEPTTLAPTIPTPSPTEYPSTFSPTDPTESPTTRSPTTRSPTSSPTTPTIPTEKPTTRSPTTRSPTEPTESPTTRSPTTKSPTHHPTTKSPTTRTPTKNPTTKSPTAPTLLEAVFITDLCMGSLHTCALSNGVVKCFGSAANGRLGLGLPATANPATANDRGDNANEMGSSLPPVQLGDDLQPVELDCGEDHTCARFSNGTSKCWGSNANGRLLLGNVDANRGSSSFPMGNGLEYTLWGSDLIVKSIVVGKAHTCAILESDDGDVVKCAGYGSNGVLGYGNGDSKGYNAATSGDSLGVVDLGDGKYAVEMFSGTMAQHNCALLNDESLKCWGSNTLGQLGLGDSSPRGDGGGEMGEALPSIDLGEARKAVSVSLGGAHTCVICNDTEAFCWGDGQYGRLVRGDELDIGIGTTKLPDSLKPLMLGLEKKAEQIAAGFEHICVLLSGHNGVKCFGRNNFGQLGQTLPTTTTLGGSLTTVGENVPPVNLGTNLVIASVHTGGTHSCVVFRGSILVKCWGNNANGRLGLGDSSPKGDSANEMGTNLKFTYIFETPTPTRSPTQSPVPIESTTQPSRSPEAVTISEGSTPTGSPQTSTPTKSPQTPVPTKSPIVPTSTPSKSPTAPTITEAPTTGAPTRRGKKNSAISGRTGGLLASAIAIIGASLLAF